MARNEQARNQRSDGEIRRDIDHRLEAADDVDADAVDVLLSEGILTLVGHVPDFDTRRRIVAICEAVSGVRDIHDRLVVSNDSTMETDVVTRGPSGRHARNVRTPKE